MNIIHWTKKDTPLIKIILIFIFTSSIEEQFPVKSYIKNPVGGYTFEQVLSTIRGILNTTKQIAKQKTSPLWRTKWI